MDKEIRVKLMQEALEARESAYCEYSGFAVGAALLCDDGSIYRGCNIENSSFGATNCAERTALFSAISNNKKVFDGIAICGGKKGEIINNFAYPCGICRQVMSEFCSPDMPVIVFKNIEEYEEYKLSELLPMSFSSDHLE